MFGNIGFPELMLLLAIALLIFGPKKLPEVGRSIGRAIREFRRTSEEIREKIEEEIEFEELKEVQQEVQKETNEEKPDNTPEKGDNDPMSSELISPQTHLLLGLIHHRGCYSCLDFQQRPFRYLSSSSHPILTRRRKTSLHHPHCSFHALYQSFLSGGYFPQFSFHFSSALVFYRSRSLPS